jgi:AraC-like DNA-binding protein
VTDLVLPTGCADVARTADRVAGAYLDRVGPGGEITDQVRQAVAALLDTPDEITATAVACHLAISPRTMQRRLRDDGTTFRDVLAEVRMTVAKQAIMAGEVPVERLADRLGFSDAAAFRRAFKRATGMTPSEFAGHAVSGGGRPSTAESRAG